MTGAVLNTINHAARRSYRRLHPRARRGEGADHRPGVRGVVGPALQRLARKPLVIDVDDALYQGPGERLGQIEYEEFLGSNAGDFVDAARRRERAAGPELHLGHHRQPQGRRLSPSGRVPGIGRQRVAVAASPPRATYLWTLPMFHCNGWCYTWAVTAMAGTHVCLRRVDPALVFRLIAQHRVTHMCGAPTVLTMLIQATPEQRTPFEQVVELQTRLLTAGQSHPGHGTRWASTSCTSTGSPKSTGPRRSAPGRRPGIRSASRSKGEGRPAGRPQSHGGRQMVAERQTLAPVPADGRTMGK